MRPVEDVFFVLEGCLTVGWEENGRTVEERLGPKDVIFNPAGRVHHFRNDGVADVEFMMLVGTSQAEDVRYQIRQSFRVGIDFHRQGVVRGGTQVGPLRIGRRIKLNSPAAFMSPKRTRRLLRRPLLPRGRAAVSAIPMLRRQ